MNDIPKMEAANDRLDGELSAAQLAHEEHRSRVPSELPLVGQEDPRCSFDVGTPFTHLVPPGETCPSCERRVPFPKTKSSPTTRPMAYRIPLDEYDAHLEVIDAVAELLGIKGEKFHRFKAISYACAAVLQQGLKVEE